jgi:hypothetical protein
MGILYWRLLVRLFWFWHCASALLTCSCIITETYDSQPGGQDIQLITPSLASKLSTNYLLETHDTPPAYILAKTTGWRTGEAEVLEALMDPERADQVDPNSYKFRIFVELETGDERYSKKINTGMWVGSGMRKGLEVIYEYVFLHFRDKADFTARIG